MKIPKGKDIEDLLDKSLRNLYREISNLRFKPNIEDNPFCQSTNKQVLTLPTFSTWESTDNAYYYNILKNKGPAKRKVTFGQIITTPLFNLLSEKQLRYQTRYQTRSNNSLEESPDDDDDNDNNNNDQGNNPPNHQLPPSPLPPPLPSNQNMNDGNGGGNNPPDGE